MLIQDCTQPISARERVKQGLKLVALYNCTSEYDINISVTNAQETYNIGEQLHACDVFSASVMMVAGTLGTLQTTADAETFTDKSLTASTTERINAIKFTSATAGFAVGDAGKIYVTADGGGTWTAKTSGVTTNLYEIYNYDGSTVFVCGAGGVILSTSDGSTFASLTSGVTKDLYSIHGYDDTHIVCCGEDGTILLSANGTSWTAKTSGVETNLLGIKYLYEAESTYHILAVGQDGTVVKSTDNGENFSTIDASITADLHGLAVAQDALDITDSIYYTCGAGGVVYKSIDAGANWTASTIGTTPFILYAVECLSTDADDAIVVGTDETVYITTNGGTAWTLSTLA